MFIRCVGEPMKRFKRIIDQYFWCLLRRIFLREFCTEDLLTLERYITYRPMEAMVNMITVMMTRLIGEIERKSATDSTMYTIMSPGWDNAAMMS